MDPRSTPLGYPVFVSTTTPGTGVPMQRLTIAQDTGGAIRGAVRADYFFGNGQSNKSTEHNIDVYALFTMLARLTGNAS